MVRSPRAPTECELDLVWKTLVGKSGSNLDTKNNFVELIDETLNLTP
jgi:hypothetical protein